MTTTVKNLFFIDFDDTLFNTKRFKKEFLEIFKQNKVSKEQFDERYYTKDKNGVLRYDLKKQIFTLQNKYGIDGEKLNREIEDFLIQDEDFLFSDAIDFLESLRDKNNYLVLLSHGEPVFQRQKILNSGVADFFQEIIISGKEKLNFILKHPQSKIAEKIFFLEDHPDQLEKTLEGILRKRNNISQKIKIIRIKRKEGRYSDKGKSLACRKVNNLRELIGKI